MRILFVTKGKVADYQSDVLFHGLVELNHEVEVSSGMEYMFDSISKVAKANLYGKGFTLFGLLPIEKRISKPSFLNQDIKKKIRDRYYDLVIFGSVWRSLDFLEEVLKSYRKEEIVFVDGEDHSKILEKLVDKGHYFKRELDLSALSTTLYPINFGIPQELVLKEVPPKDRFLATIIPDVKSTYIYATQADYYNGYIESFFAITTKKAGWDCMRHYEILLNGCIPIFPNLDKCPPFTMDRFPKQIVGQCNKMLNELKFSESLYHEKAKELLDYTSQHLRTIDVANYVVSKTVK